RAARGPRVRSPGEGAGRPGRDRSGERAARRRERGRARGHLRVEPGGGDVRALRRALLPEGDALAAGDEPRDDGALRRERRREGGRVREGAGGVGVRAFALSAFERLARQPIFVPPTVMRSILMVGQPTPTGTLCPSLPQVQIPSLVSRSLPSMVTLRSTSGPLPIRFTPLSGAVSLPSSIR